MARVAIVEGNGAPATWIQRLLEMDPSLEIVASVAGFRAAPGIVPAKPDIVLVDCGLPEGDGVELAGRLAKALPRARVYTYTSGPPPRRLPDQVGFLRAEDMHLWRRFLTEPAERSALLAKHPSP